MRGWLTKTRALVAQTASAGSAKLICNDVVIPGIAMAQ
jgi:hypothetical protein